MASKKNIETINLHVKKLPTGKYYNKIEVGYDLCKGYGVIPYDVKIISTVNNQEITSLEPNTKYRIEISVRCYESVLQSIYS